MLCSGCLGKLIPLSFTAAGLGSDDEPEGYRQPNFKCTKCGLIYSWQNSAA